MTKILVLNVLCVIVTLVIIIADIIGNTTLIYQSDIK